MHLRYGECGFTLIEIIVAMVVFSIVFLPVTSVLVAESKFERNYRLRRVAMAVAKNEIEKSKRFFMHIDDDEYDISMGGKTWNVRRTVEKLEGAITSDSSQLALRAVTVRVSRESDTAALAEFTVLKETYE